MKGRVQFDALFEDVSFPSRKCTTVSEASRSLAGIHHTNPRRVRALCKACPMREHGPRGARRSRGRGRCARGGRRSKAARSSLCSAHRDRVRPHCSPRWRAHRRSAKREREGKKGRPAGRSETNSTIFDPAQPTQCQLSTGRDPGDAPVGPGSLLKSHRRGGTIQSQPRTGSQRCGCCAAQMWVGTHGVIGRAHQSHSHSFLLRLGQHRYLDSFRKPVKTSACTSILKDRQLQVRRSLPPRGLCDRLRGDAHGLPSCSLPHPLPTPHGGRAQKTYPQCIKHMAYIKEHPSDSPCFGGLGRKRWDSALARPQPSRARIEQVRSSDPGARASSSMSVTRATCNTTCSARAASQQAALAPQPRWLGQPLPRGRRPAPHRLQLQSPLSPTVPLHPCPLQASNCSRARRRAGARLPRATLSTAATARRSRRRSMEARRRCPRITCCRCFPTARCFPQQTGNESEILRSSTA